MVRRVAAVDGCRAGWLLAVADDWPNTKPNLKLCGRFEDVIHETVSCDVTVVDIPIGLPTGASERFCDTQARKAICDRRVSNAHSRVFRAPPRSALQQLDWQAFQKHITKLTGVSPTKQAFDFSAKIRDVDNSMNPELQQRILEFHPEPTWKRLAGCTLQSKHTASGLLQRLKVLQEAQMDCILGLVDDPAARKVTLDDLLDAIVGLAVADSISRYSQPLDRHAELKKDVGVHRYPEGKPEIDDDKKLRMEIWF
jgi:threonine dehydratase